MKKLWIAAAATLAIYAVLTIPLALWPSRLSVIGLVGFGLYCLLAFGLALDTVEVLLALLWPRPDPVPRARGVPPRRSTAILMTVCDDADEECLLGLASLADAGYSVFVLDDSAAPVRLPGDVAAVAVHVRRPSRRGAKAGNLNHWLARFGASFDFAAILDSDSRVPVGVVDTLVAMARHPANETVALFQSKVEPRSEGATLFARLAGCGARPRARVLERVHRPLGLVLSSGHNQLLRLSALRQLGGLDEEITAEDTVLSLDLAAAGWRLEYADVWSSDSEPQTPAAHRRRTLRWARQTVEVFHRARTRAPLRLKLLMCRHLLSYALPIAGIALLALSLWTIEASPRETWEFLSSALGLRDGYALYGLALWPPIAIFLLYLGLRSLLALLEGVSWRAIAADLLLGNATDSSSLLPLAGSMLASAVGYRVRFVPTNQEAALRADGSMAGRWLPALSSLLLLSILLAAAYEHPAGLLVGFNLLWLSRLGLSPISMLLLTAAASSKLKTTTVDASR